MPKREPARVAAARTLAHLLQHKGSLTRLLPAATSAVAPRDQPLVAELCYGVCRFYPRLQGLLDLLVKKPLKGKDADIRALLLVGLYQLQYTRIPDHAAISATVAATQQLNKEWARSLVNGVLRQYQRNAELLSQQLDEAEASAHPAWMLDKFKQQWPQRWSSLVDANNAAAPMTLRVNPRQSSRDNYLERLAQAGIGAQPCRFSPVGVTLESPCEVAALPGFGAGACSVQDEASQLAAPLLRPEDHSRILDCCCAPGGKTGHLLELMDGDSSLDAVEIDGERLQRVQQNLFRLSLEANLIQGDATTPDQWWRGEQYDAILLDAPCSASGVIRRHPDIKLLRNPGDISKLNRLQGQLLASLWPCLQPGGLLLYTTCSVFQEENDAVIGAFTTGIHDARALPLSPPWGVATRWGRQLLPESGANDGFFYALIRKTEAAEDAAKYSR
jgi:16S rRNA (cytosine967-C5)-methyltransferase